MVKNRAPKDGDQSASSPSSPQPHRRLGFVLLAVCLLAGGAAKVLPSHDAVLGGDEVRLLGADSYYHLRHARSVANHWPSLNRWDVGTHFPSGQRSQNAATFDWLGGTLAALGLFGDASSDDAVASAIAWLPPIFALVLIAALFGVGRAIGGPVLGAAMAALFVLYPGTTSSKMALGFADHHGLEVALLGMTGWSLIRSLAAPQSWRWPVLTGAVLALFFFSWAGAPLVIAGVAVGLLVAWVVATIAAQDPSAIARSAMLTFASFAGITAAVLLVYSDAALIPGLAWPAVVLGALGAGVAAAAPRLSPWFEQGGRVRRILAASVLLLPVVAIGVGALLSPAIRAGLDLAAATKVSSIAEHARTGMLFQLSQFGLVLVLAPLGILAVAVQALRGRCTLAAVAVGVLALVVILANFLSGDYAYLAAPMLSVLAALALWQLAPSATSGRPRKVIVGGIAAIIVASPLLAWTASPWLESKVLPAYLFFDDAWADATRWLRNNSLESPVDIDAPVEDFGDRRCGYDYPDGSYGVMVPWSFGNFVAAKGRRPVYWSQGASKWVAEWFIGKDEDFAVDSLRDSCDAGEDIRYAVIDSRTAGPQAGALFDQAGSNLTSRPEQRRIIVGGNRIRLYSFGKEFERGLFYKLHAEEGHDLARFRLVHATSEQHLVGYRVFPSRAGPKINRIAQPMTEENRSELERVARSRLPAPSRYGYIYDAYLGPAIKIFEVVPSARITGTTGPYVKVQVTLELERPDGSVYYYRREGKANRWGTFFIKVAHPTEYEEGTYLRPRGSYSIRVDGKPRGRKISVTLDQVRGGRPIDLGMVPVPR